MPIKRTMMLSVVFVAMSLSHAWATLNCETTYPDNTVSMDDHGNPVDETFYAVADCHIEMPEGSTFEVLSGDHAQFIAEQGILLRPGFHAMAGSSFRARIRDCVRNPNYGEGYASWGSMDLSGNYPTRMWMEMVAENFIDNFDNLPGWTFGKKYTTLSKVEPNTAFFQDASLPFIGAAGDDERTVDSEHGIDEGVIYFHVGHGGIESADPPNRSWFDGRIIDVHLSEDTTQQEMLLGNCSSDGQQGELRYLWLCACRTLAHGPPVIDTDDGAEQYDRPSEFDPTDNSHANVFARVSPILGDNLRMACGISTSGTCSGSNDHDGTVNKLWEAYNVDNLSVADSWGQGTSGFTVGPSATRDIITTPVCIARGNNDSGNFKSPITEDLRFTNKANPYDGAIHIVSWETMKGVTDDHYQVATQSVPVALPAFNIASQPVDPVDSRANFAYDGTMLVSHEINNDGLPKVRIDPETGQINLTSNRQNLTSGMSGEAWSDKQYFDAAKLMIGNLGWSETDIGQVDTVKSILQVFPDEQDETEEQVIKLLKDITFTFKREIAIGQSMVDVHGADNRIVVQLNPNGTMKHALKNWKRIGEEIENVPIKNYSLAYVEALNKLDDPSSYTLSSWRWGYQSALTGENQEMLLMHYYFMFVPTENQPYSATEEMEVAVLGHMI